MKRPAGDVLWRLFKGAAYAALAIILAGLALVLVGDLKICRGHDYANMPKYCGLAGIGMFVYFMYFITVLPAFLAAVGAVLFVLDVVRLGHRIVAKSRRSSVPDQTQAL